jgi:hypothetical protein
LPSLAFLGRLGRISSTPFEEIRLRVFVPVFVLVRLLVVVSSSSFAFSSAKVEEEKALTKVLLDNPFLDANCRRDCLERKMASTEAVFEES